MKKIILNLAQGSSTLFVGNQLLSNIGHLLNFNKKSTIHIVWDQKLKNEYQKIYESLFAVFPSVHSYPVMGNERLKNFKKIIPLYGKLLQNKADRSSIIISLGGGSVGDSVGFLSSTYMRGISWVNCPTTLLSQVDSCIGGKTAINHRYAKNLIGTFYHPKMVICDPLFIQTLTQEDYISGLGEVFKYAITLDKKLFFFLQENIKKILSRDKKVLEAIIFRSLLNKAKIVKQDPYEKRGIREILNFGHTIGHALEILFPNHQLPHGHAVILGMRAALWFSKEERKLSLHTFSMVNDVLDQLAIHIPTHPISLQKILGKIKYDKKRILQSQRFILLEDIGKPMISPQLSPHTLRAGIRYLSNFGINIY